LNEEQNTLASDAPPPPVQMLQMIAGFWVSRAIYAAAKLGVADLVASAPKSVEELAAATQTHAPSLYRVLRALSSVGVFARDAEGRFAQTPLSATLTTDTPGSLRWLAMTELGEEHYPAWEELLFSVKTGERAFDRRFGKPVWEFFAENPENARIFNNAMTGTTAVVTEAVLGAYDFSWARKVLDVGGGHGGLLASILKATPRASGVLFDAPQVVADAGARLAAAGVADRCEIVGGDFFESVPAGADAYTMKWILHDWDDEQSTRILKNVRRAVAADGRLLVIEAVIPANDEPHFGKFIDLNMLVMTGGRERTEAEFRALLAAADFRLARVVPTPSPVSVIEAVPA
jgi:ubiquinone/menaquinone biosynthesis C-methylase UbiE